MTLTAKYRSPVLHSDTGCGELESGGTECDELPSARVVRKTSAPGVEIIAE